MKFLIFIYLFIYLLLWLHVQYTEVLGSGLEYRATAVTYATATATPDLICIYDLHHSLQQCWILNPVGASRD